MKPVQAEPVLLSSQSLKRPELPLSHSSHSRARSSGAGRTKFIQVNSKVNFLGYFPGFQLQRSISEINFRGQFQRSISWFSFQGQFQRPFSKILQREKIHFKTQNNEYLIHAWLENAFKGADVNQTFPSWLRASLEIKLTVSLNQ